MRKFLIPVFCFVFSSSFSQWNSNTAMNNAISVNSTSEYQPISISDGAGGSITFFERLSTSDIYAQKITAVGTIAWGNAGLPVMICNATNEQYGIYAIADGLGGAFVSWYDFRHDVLYAEIYVQHINAAGNALWTANGIRVTNTINIDEFAPFMCNDGAGGIIISWNWDNRVDNLQVSSQRYNSEGIALWNAVGVQASIAPGFRGGMDIISDGANGAIISFIDTRNDPKGLNYDDVLNSVLVNTDMFSQRLSATGTRLWGDNALPVCVAAGNQENVNVPSLVSDGTGGAIILYEDGRNDVPDLNGNSTNVDIFAQRINASGQPQFALNGIPLSIAGGNQFFYQVIADAANGFIAAWEDENTGRLVTQKLNSAGNISWAINGIGVSPAGIAVGKAALTADGSGNYIYTYIPTAGNVVDVQKINAAGAIQWGAAGVTVCNAPNVLPNTSRLVNSDNGSAIIVWDDSRNYIANGYDIYASKILSNGVLAGISFSGYSTIANGNWNNPATWQGGLVPPPSAPVLVRHQVLVTVNAICYSAIVEQPGGKITVNGGITFTVAH